MTALLAFLMNFLTGLACCDTAANPSSCEPIQSLDEVGGCVLAWDVEVSWCVTSPASECAALEPYDGDIRCCPVGDGFVTDASDCALALGQATIGGVTYYGCDGKSEAVLCDSWFESAPGVFACDL